MLSLSEYFLRSRIIVQPSSSGSRRVKYFLSFRRTVVPEDEGTKVLKQLRDMFTRLHGVISCNDSVVRKTTVRTNLTVITLVVLRNRKFHSF